MRLPVLPPRTASVAVLAVALAGAPVPGGAASAERPGTSLPGASVTRALVSGTSVSGTSATSTSSGTSSTAAPADDPAGWPDGRLAAQLVLAGVDMGRLETATEWVRAGIGGVVLFGTPPDDLARRLTALRAAGQVTPLVASDEEGGRVQRLTRLLGALPSAESLGRSRSPEEVRRLAYSYGVRMRAAGVDLDLAPVADLAITGHYVEQLDRGFSADPATAGAFVVGWQEGMRAGHVATSVKHWPGHGEASDTHRGAATTPPLDVLERRDLVPFRRSMAAGVPAVMVGHLTVPGLTERGTPASLSPAALGYLRRQAGPAALLLTDSLSMGAVTTALRLTPAQASVRALQAGADVALVDSVDPLPVVAAVRDAITSGRVPRERAVASARRVLAVKALVAAPAVASSPAATGMGDGSALTAWTDPTGAVQVRRLRDGRWERTTDLGGAAAAAPALARTGGAVVAAARFTDGRVRTRTWRGGGWSPWADTGATGVGAPALAAVPDGRLVLATLQADGRILLRTTRPTGGWVAGGEVLRSTAAPGLAAVGDEVVVTGRDAAGRVVVRSARAGRWQAPVLLDGVVDGPASLTADPRDGSLLLAAAGPDRRVRIRVRTADGWRTWTDLAGAATAAPAVVAVAPRTAVALVRAGAYADLHARPLTAGAPTAPWRRWS